MPKPKHQGDSPLSAQGTSQPISPATPPGAASFSDRLCLWLLVLSVTLAGLALAAWGGWQWNSSHLEALIVLAAIAIIAERFDLSLYGDSRVSLAFVPIFAAVLLADLPGLTLVVPPAIFISSLGTDRPLHKTLFNFGALMLAGAASALVFHAFGSASAPDAWPEVVGPSLLAAGANFTVNTALVALVIALTTGHTPWSVWAEKFAWLCPHYLVLGFLGLAIAVAYNAMGPWGIAVFLAPPVMMRLSIKQYLDRTTKSVLELKQAHDELSETHRQVVETMNQLEGAYEGTLKALVAALDVRDSETRGHSERVAEMTMALAEEMGFIPDTPEWRHLQWGALLHDVGKIGVPDEVLRKPGSFSEHEWAAMRVHPATGHEMLSEVEFLRQAAEIVHAHHERYDGSGYPRGLKGEQIPLGARIFSLADAFDAMTSNRPYRRAMSPEHALAEILRNSGSQFDPAAVEAFLSVYQKRVLHHPYPPSGNLSDTLKKAILEAAGLDTPHSR